MYPFYYKTQFLSCVSLKYDVNHVEIKFWIDYCILLPSVATSSSHLYTKNNGICSNTKIEVVLFLPLGQLWEFRDCTAKQA